MDAPTTCEDLPEECWELILNHLNYDHNSHFQCLSLVSTRLLTLTDRLRRRFTVVDQTFIIHGTISKLLQRFTDLKSIDLSQLTTHAHFESSLLEISRSNSLLHLESLDISNQKFLPLRFLKELGSQISNLKVLKCAKLSRLSDEDLIAVANSFSDLEEFDISYPRNLVDFSGQSAAGVTDGGIEFLCFKLKSLRKIDISGNHFLTCKSIVALSSNCLRLTDISMFDCPFIRLDDIRFMLRNSRELSAVSMSAMECLSGSSLLFLESANYGRCLSSLDFQYSDVSDEFLFSIAKACLPLKRISLSGCAGYTCDGVSLLLGAYRCLEFLNLTGNSFLTDQSMIGLVQHLHRLVAIKLNSCSRLTDATLSAVIKNCPFLQDVEMKDTSVGKDGGNSFTEFMENPSIKCVSLASNFYLNDTCLIKMGLVSRNLQRLDVSLCPRITGYSIGEIGKSCPEIRHLSLNDCKGVKNIMLSQELPKLESLLAARSGLSDEGLEKIGKKCGGILELGLADCLNVTNTGVENVVRCCRKLRKIDLKGCRGVDKSIVDWIVFTRPSVRRLTPPCYDATTGNQRKLLLRHGCHVCEVANWPV